MWIKYKFPPNFLFTIWMVIGHGWAKQFVKCHTIGINIMFLYMLQKVCPLQDKTFEFILFITIISLVFIDLNCP
jgi:hypothetical protein